MKYIYLLLIVCCFTAVKAQTDPNSIHYKNVVLKEEGDSLVMAFDVFIPSLKSKQSLVIIPELKGLNGTRLVCGYIQVNGKNKDKTLRRTAALKNNKHWEEYPAIMEVMPRKEGKTIHYSLSLPYESWMDEGFLTFNHTMVGCALSVYNFGLDPVIRVVTAPRAPAIPPVNYVAPQPIVKERNSKGEAFLDFPRGDSRIDPTYRRNPEELRKTMQLVTKASGDKDITLHDIRVTGYASPEGTAASNESLAQKRANSLKEYIREVSGIPGSKFIVHSAGEDWEGLRNLVEEMDIRQKERILAIIDNHETLDRKEQQLKALGAPYHHLLADAFPALRRVEYRVNYTVRDYSLTESQELLNSDPSKLNSYELYLLANLYEVGSDKWNEIIKLTETLYPNEPEANINGAAVYINTGEYSKAKRCLERVKHLPEAQHNLFIYEEMERQGLLK